MKRVIWKRACFAVQGRSHLSDQTPCQDSVATAYRRNVNVIALSDGAGSASLSHFGSKECAQTLCNVLCRRFDEIWRMNNIDAKLSVTQELCRQVEDKAHDLNSITTDLAATALAVGVKRNRYIAIHLGDGAIGIELTNSDSTTELKTLSSPDNGEHSNETYFITSNRAAEHVRIYTGTLDEQRPAVITGFILMSDGPEAALYRKADNQLAPACLKLLESSRELNRRDMQTGLRATLELIANTKTFDDCSIALLSHTGESKLTQNRKRSKCQRQS